jgi:POT family proton-dependent oligopeptide transporter
LFSSGSDHRSRLHQEFDVEKTDIAGGTLPDPAALKAAEAGYGDEKEGQVAATAASVYDEPEPTEEERRTLRRIGENLPISAWLVAIVELCERFTYYGVQGLFQNYVQRPLDGSLGRGALGELYSRTSVCVCVHNREGRFADHITNIQAWATRVLPG